MPKKKRTLQQNRIIHSLAGKWNFTSDDKAEMVFDITEGRTESTKDLSVDEANLMIKRLGGTPVQASRRTVNYHRQKAGVKQLMTRRQENFLLDLAKKRNISEPGLRMLCHRTIKKPHPRTTIEASKVIEAIKSMNERDKAKPSTNSNREAA